MSVPNDEYDNLLLSHADRSRFGAADRRRFAAAAGPFKGSVLVDGMVEGIWHSEHDAATKAVTAPHLTLRELQGKALVIHEGGDNYSDQPKPNGGGGARIVCGVIQAGEK